MSYRLKNKSLTRHRKSRNIENVLILQGGGSLGAFACGVYKAFKNQNIRLDIIAGTSIGAINAAIIGGSKTDEPVNDLENFWIEVGENNIQILPDLFYYDWDSDSKQFIAKKASAASLNAAIFGVPKIFVPRWFSFENEDKNKNLWDYYFDIGKNIDVRNWTFLYDHSPLEKTLDKYIDYKKLNRHSTKAKESSNGIRLIITAVDVLNGTPLVFDNAHMEIKSKHILASSGYPIYGFPWIKVEENTYGWDGSLLSNTPIREVLYVSPRNDKNIFIVENYAQKIDELPSNMAEVINRYKDILFSDKDIHNIKMAKLVTRHIRLIEKLYDIFEKYIDPSVIKKDDEEFIHKEYKNLIEKYGAEIKSVTRIIRNEHESPHVLKNADYTLQTIKQLIEHGEHKAMEKIKSCKLDYDFNTKKNY